MKFVANVYDCSFVPLEKATRSFIWNHFSPCVSIPLHMIDLTMSEWHHYGSTMEQFESSDPALHEELLKGN